MTSYTNIPSPIGELLLTTDGEAISGLYIQDGLAAVEPDAGWRRDDGPFADARAQLGEYFAGERTEFDLPLAPDGTEFQRRVWDELRAIPYGETRSYAELARALGKPGAARAVGSANARNPITVIVPCHRVIGSSGDLAGFSGGVERKRLLLDLEATGEAPKFYTAAARPPSRREASIRHHSAIARSHSASARVRTAT
jgi:methylated-DNA-[protein]-cysteine S-methyltransferase